VKQRCDSLCATDDPFTAHCGGFTVTNGLPECGSQSGHPDLVVEPAGTAYVVSTDEASITLGGVTIPALVVTPAEGPEIAAYKLGSIHVLDGAEIVAVGSRALAFYAERDVVIAGAVRAGAGTRRPFLGSLLMPPAGSWTLISTWDGGPGGPVVGFSGAGGGGHATAGGDGGQGGMLPAFGAGGVAYGTATLSPLLGGSLGGTLTLAVAAGQPFGGGAVEIVGCGSLVIGPTGVVSANGFGGAGGVGGDAQRGGTGGGAGGAILLESPSIEIDGVVTAHGGGGGGGGCDAGDGSRGQDGQESLEPASGGMGAACAGPLVVAGAGGTGGVSVDFVPGSGGAAAADPAAGGGGGGAAGRVRLNSLEGGTQLSADAIVSPLGADSQGGLVVW